MKSMRRLVLGAAAFALLLPGIAAARNMTFKGEIWDSNCAKLGSHEAMMKAHPNVKTAKECTLGCVKMGAKFVLYNPATKMIYELDNQKAPRPFAGDKVRVIGTYDKATDTIHVVSIHGA
jgi:hypothetical protein